MLVERDAAAPVSVSAVGVVLVSDSVELADSVVDEVSDSVELTEEEDDRLLEEDVVDDTLLVVEELEEVDVSSSSSSMITTGGGLVGVSSSSPVRWGLRLRTIRCRWAC